MFASVLKTPARMFDGFTAWWRAACRRRSDLRHLESSGQIDAIARDAGLSTSDLRRLAGEGPRAAELDRRMRAIGLDPGPLRRTEPGVARDLQRTCSLCSSKRRCRHDLKARPAEPTWQDYCPNAPTLNALREPPGLHASPT